jgi:hypothetical protein
MRNPDLVDVGDKTEASIIVPEDEDEKSFH